jgi:hypothetical protein
MSPVGSPFRSATLSVEAAVADVDGRYGGDCKTIYTGSSPVVASIILSGHRALERVPWQRLGGHRLRPLRRRRGGPRPVRGARGGRDHDAIVHPWDRERYLEWG